MTCYAEIKPTGPLFCVMRGPIIIYPPIPHPLGKELEFDSVKSYMIWSTSHICCDLFVVSLIVHVQQ